MRWHRHWLLALFLLTVSVVSCAAPDVPKDLWIDSKFSAEETERIMAAADFWNEAGLEHVGKELIRIRGIRTDENGFQREDLVDSVNFVHCIRDRETYVMLVGTGRKDIGSLGLDSDIIVFTFIVQEYDDDYPGVTLTRTMAHEMGHFLGLPHLSDPDSIMFSHETVVNRDQPPKLSDGDTAAICQLFGCDK